MSLDLINHKLTTSTTDKNGVTTVQVKYRTTIVDGGNKLYANVSFNSLFARIVLGEKLGVRTIRLKDEKKGYNESNIIILSNRKGITKQDTNTKQPLADTQELKDVKVETKKEVTKYKHYYTVYEAKNEHTTEDGAVFPSKELAEWHQEKVSKGKGNAQVVLDYNGGYVLAEQIYLQEVVYNKAKPYTNFVDVLNNNQGIVSVVQDEHCVFDKLDKQSGLSPVQLELFGLDKVINLSCTKIQAEKINTSLNKYSEAFSKLEDEHKTLKDLLKQVS